MVSLASRTTCTMQKPSLTLVGQFFLPVVLIMVLTGIPYGTYDAETKPPTHIKQNGSHSAAELFDSDSDVKEASDESDEYKLQGGSEDDLNDSEDDLQALKGDSRKLKEVLDLEVCR